MVVLEAEVNQLMMHTSICIGQIQPAHSQRLVLPVCLVDDGHQLFILLQTTRNAQEKCLLHCGVKVAIQGHKP